MNLREQIHREALENRRALVRGGVLLPESDFRARLGINRQKLERIVASGNVFPMEVDGEPYYPAFLADTALDQKRLRSVCRILAAAPAAARFEYLRSARGSLGGITALDSLHPDSRYHHLRKMARAWVAEWSRTWVRVYEGIHAKVPRSTSAMYQVAVEADPREPLWKRAALAMRSPGYVQPPEGPYASARTMTVTIGRADAETQEHVGEAQLEVTLVEGMATARVVSSSDVQQGDSQQSVFSAPVQAGDSVVEVVARILSAVAAARRHAL